MGIKNSSSEVIIHNSGMNYVIPDMAATASHSLESMRKS
jgi:hypothetical protein